METEIAQESTVANTRNGRMRPLSRSFELIAWLEGVSYLLILFVTMPMKYMMDMPVANKVVGMVHGLLFVAYLALALEQMLSSGYGRRWALNAFVASVIPFGTFIFVARHQKAARPAL